MKIRADHAVRTVLVSCLAGLLLGAAGRVTMRIVAVDAGQSPGFSLGGSSEVVAFGALIGAPVAYLYFAVYPRVQPQWPWLGAVCGLGLFGLLTIVPPPAARSALAATPETVAPTIMFGVLFAAWGLSLDFLRRHLLQARRRSGSRPAPD